MSDPTDANFVNRRQSRRPSRRGEGRSFQNRRSTRGRVFCFRGELTTRSTICARTWAPRSGAGLFWTPDGTVTCPWHALAIPNFATAKWGRQSAPRLSIPTKFRIPRGPNSKFGPKAQITQQRQLPGISSLAPAQFPVAGLRFVILFSPPWEKPRPLFSDPAFVARVRSVNSNRLRRAVPISWTANRPFATFKKELRRPNSAPRMDGFSSPVSQSSKLIVNSA